MVETFQILFEVIQDIFTRKLFYILKLPNQNLIFASQGPFGFLAPQDLNYLTLSVPDEGYYRNVLCTVTWISTFVFST